MDTRNITTANVSDRRSLIPAWPAFSFSTVLRTPPLPVCHSGTPHRVRWLRFYFVGILLPIVLTSCAFGPFTFGSSNSGGGYWLGKPPGPVQFVPLPAPTALPTGSVDDQAASLAHGILSAPDDQHVIPLLLTAMKLGGFRVRGSDGSVLFSPASSPGQDVAFESWEVYTIARMSTSKMAITLSDLSGAIDQAIPELAGASISTTIVDTIKTQAQSSSPTLRFWARFIVELGRQANQPFDLLGQSDQSSLTLDGVQMAFILRSLVAELVTYANSQTPTSQAGSPSGTLASIAGIALHHETTLETARQTESSLPCTMSETERIISDVTGKVSTKAWGKLLGYLSKQGVQGAKLTRGLLIGANNVLSWAQLIASYALLKVNVELIGGQPLLRTKSTIIAGEQRHLIADVRMDVGNLQLVNCIRLFLNGYGLDFSVPADGAIANSPITWVLSQGGTSLNPAVQNNSEPIVRFFGGDPVHGLTDEHGHAQIGVEGLPQKEHVPANAPEVLKQASVIVGVPLKKMAIKKDVVGLLFTSISSVGKALLTPAEILARNTFLPVYSVTYTFDVRDWSQGPWYYKVLSASGLITAKWDGGGIDQNGPATEVHNFTCCTLISAKPNGTIGDRQLSPVDYINFTAMLKYSSTWSSLNGCTDSSEGEQEVYPEVRLTVQDPTVHVSWLVENPFNWTGTTFKCEYYSDEAQNQIAPIQEELLQQDYPLSKFLGVAPFDISIARQYHGNGFDVTWNFQMMLQQVDENGNPLS